MAVPPNLIPAGADRITPDMLPLVELTGEQIGQIAAGVDGGAANVADIYPLAPLQEGMFFHHLMAGPDTADVYLASMVLRFDSRERLEEFLAALEQVIARHDIYGPSVAWEGLPEPVQVVWRQAGCRSPRSPWKRPATGPAAAGGGLLAAVPARMDLTRAPLLRLTVAAEPGTGRWLALLQIHHMVLDHTGPGRGAGGDRGAAGRAGGRAAGAAAVPGLRGPGPAGRARGRSTSGTSPGCWGT